MKKLFLLFLFSVSLYSTDLIKSGDYVIDKTNNKMWQDTQENVKLLFSQEAAQKYCEKLNLGGYSDWRLPDIEDYKQILDMSRKEELKISRKFTYALADDYWASNRTWRNFGQYGYYVFFKSGAFYYQNRTYPKYVKCIRDLK